MTYKQLDDLLCIHGGEEYSGRGMFGAKCLSVTTHGESPLALLARIVADCTDVAEASELLRGAEMDSMGRDTVIYWPNIKIPA